MKNINQFNSTGAQIFFGAEAIKTVYNQTLNTRALDVVCLSQNYAQIIGSFFDKEYAPKLFSSRIVTREILPDIKENRDYAKNKNQAKNAVRFIRVITPSESDYMLYGDSAALISYNPDSPFAVLITDRDIVANLRNQFEALWRNLGS